MMFPFYLLITKLLGYFFVLITKYHTKCDKRRTVVNVNLYNIYSIHII